MSLNHLPVRASGWFAGQGQRAVAFVRAVAFWLAIVLPVALLVATVTGHVGGSPELVVWVVADVVCLFVGHGHSPG